MNLGGLVGVIDNLKALGTERLIALAIAVALVLGLIAGTSYLASRSTFETLYIGLSPQDVSRMGAALADAGIAFETSLDGSKLGVPIGRGAEARALLAEKGLPGSQNAGYELFDNLGVLGLTSFMQQITKVRALEGELSRTIQYIKGVKSARVHLVIPDPSSSRTKKSAPSASVVLGSGGVAIDTTVAAAIRHVVAAAIPEMTPDQISIVGTDGRLLAGGGQSPADASSKLIELEQNVAQNIQENVRRTLTPYFGPANFEVSALARLNIDKRQSTETAYDPDKRVERSVRVVKEAENSQNGKTSNAVGVEQNIPNESTSSSGSDQTRRAQDRKEETTNYEISSKSASTVSDGYRIENISVALVVNRKRISEMLGKEPTEDEIKSQIATVEKLVQSAAGLDTKRGDRVDIAAVNFAADALDTAGSGSGWTLTLLNLAGTLIKSLTVLLVAAIIVWAGFRPLMRVLIASGPQAALQAPAAVGALEGPSPAPSAGSLSAPEDLPQMASPLLEAGANPFGDAMSGSDFGFGRSMASGPVERLAQLLEQDEEHAAAVLKHWIRAG